MLPVNAAPVPLSERPPNHARVPAASPMSKCVRLPVQSMLPVNFAPAKLNVCPPPSNSGSAASAANAERPAAMTVLPDDRAGLRAALDAVEDDRDVGRVDDRVAGHGGAARRPTLMPSVQVSACSEPYAVTRLPRIVAVAHGTS